MFGVGVSQLSLEFSCFGILRSGCFEFWVFLVFALVSVCSGCFCCLLVLEFVDFGCGLVFLAGVWGV